LTSNPESKTLVKRFEVIADIDG